MADDDREWTERDAKRERVTRRTCVDCKTHREDLPPNKSLRTIETGEVVCDDCLERLRRFKRDMDVDLRVDGELDENTREVVEQSFHYLSSRLDGVREVTRNTPEGPTLIGLDLSEVQVEEDDEAPTQDVK